MESQKSDKSSLGYHSKREAPMVSRSSASEHHIRESKKIKDTYCDNHQKGSSNSSDDEASEKPKVHLLSKIGKSLSRIKIENDDVESSGESSSEEDMNWINWFLSQPGNYFYLRIPNEYLEDEFNLAELSSRIPFYRHALDILLDLESASDSDKEDQETRHRNDKHTSSNISNNSLKPTPRESRTACKMLYSLMHSRYLLTRHGLAHMADRYEKGYFGTCPRYYCEKTRVIPAGLSDTPGQARVQVYCPSCNDVYQLPSVFHRVDGAAFGTSFPHIFFKTYSEFVQSLPKPKIYDPKIYGFKLHRKPFNHRRKHNRSLSREREDPECSLIDIFGFTGSTTTDLSSIESSRTSSVESSIESTLRSIGIVENMSWIRSLPNYNRDNINIQD